MSPMRDEAKQVRCQGLSLRPLAINPPEDCGDNRSETWFDMDAGSVGMILSPAVELKGPCTLLRFVSFRFIQTRTFMKM